MAFFVVSIICGNAYYVECTDGWLHCSKAINLNDDRHSSVDRKHALMICANGSNMIFKIRDRLAQCQFSCLGFEGGGDQTAG